MASEGLGKFSIVRSKMKSGMKVRKDLSAERWRQAKLRRAERHRQAASQLTERRVEAARKEAEQRRKREELLGSMTPGERALFLQQEETNRLLREAENRASMKDVEDALRRLGNHD